MSEDLKHYGVKGMEWGKRKKRKTEYTTQPKGAKTIYKETDRAKNLDTKKRSVRSFLEEVRKAEKKSNSETARAKAFREISEGKRRYKPTQVTTKGSSKYVPTKVATKSSRSLGDTISDVFKNLKDPDRLQKELRKSPTERKADVDRKNMATKALAKYDKKKASERDEKRSRAKSAISDLLKNVGLKEKSPIDKARDASDKLLKNVGLKKKTDIDKLGDDLNKAFKDVSKTLGINRSPLEKLVSKLKGEKQPPLEKLSDDLKKTYDKISKDLSSLKVEKKLDKTFKDLENMKKSTVKDLSDIVSKNTKKIESAFKKIEWNMPTIKLPKFKKFW